MSPKAVDPPPEGEVTLPEDEITVSFEDTSEVPAASEAEEADAALGEEEKEEFRIHPSAAIGDLGIAPEGVQQEFFIGMWGPKPNYGCPYCSYATLSSTDDGEDGHGQIELHVLSKIDAGDFVHRQALIPKE